MDNQKPENPGRKELPLWLVSYPLHFLISIQCLCLVFYYLFIPSKDYVLPHKGIFLLLSNFMSDNYVLLLIALVGIVMMIAVIKLEETVMKICLHIAASIFAMMTLGSLAGYVYHTVNAFGLIFVIPLLFACFLASAVEGG